VSFVLRSRSVIKDVLKEEKTIEFPDDLKSGKLLCRLINVVRPGMISKIHDAPIPLLERENIQSYLNACAGEYFGIAKHDLFTVSDLYEDKYLLGVIQNLCALAERVKRLPYFSGPYLET